MKSSGISEIDLPKKSLEISITFSFISSSIKTAASSLTDNKVFPKSEIDCFSDNKVDSNSFIASW